MRTIIDITQLAGWQGKLTGIPRVMYELSSRFAKLDENTIFIGWDAGRQIFWEIPFSEIKLKRDKTETAESLEIDERGNAVIIKQALRYIYNISPEPIRSIGRRIKVNIYKKNSEKINNPGFMFKKADKLIVLWGEWADAEYRKKLVDSVNRNDVGLYQIVYDMLPLVTPQYSSHSTKGLTDYVNEIYPLCKKLISISESTKSDVCEWLKDHELNAPEIDVIRLGENFEKAKPHMPDLSLFRSGQPYITCVGTIETRKNHMLLYYVYKLAKARGVLLPPIVVVGRRGWLTENIYDLIVNDPDTRDLFVFLHDTSDEELSWIYDHSLFSIYPSHYEGWGLPVAESIAHGVPCISSNTSSLPEIAGDLISYFSPVSTDECLQSICDLLDSNNLRKAKQKIKNYKPTSWDETFGQIQAMIGGKHE